MKILLIAVFAASLLFSAENSSVELPNNRLTPAEVAKWKPIQARIGTPDPVVAAKKAEMDAKKLAYYEAKEAWEAAGKASAAALQADFDKLKAESKRAAECGVDFASKSDEPRWVCPTQPPAPISEQPKEKQ